MLKALGPAGEVAASVGDADGAAGALIATVAQNHHLRIGQTVDEAVSPSGFHVVVRAAL